MSEEPYSVIGKSVPRNDLWDKVTGRAKYVADTMSPGMLHAKASYQQPRSRDSSLDRCIGAGAILTFNQDGSINLHTAAVELGQGAKTVLAQIAAEKFRMDVDKIHIVLGTDTCYDPHQWKTVASSTTMLAGRAVMAAADDAIAREPISLNRQLLSIGAYSPNCSNCKGMKGHAACCGIH